MQRGETALFADQFIERVRTRRPRNAGATNTAAARRGGRSRRRVASPSRRFGVLAVANFRLKRIFGGNHVREVHDFRRQRRVGTASQQDFHDINAIECGGKHQRRLSVRGFSRVDLCPAIEQRVDRVDVAAGRRQHQRRGARRRHRADGRAGIHQPDDDGGGSALTREMQRRISPETGRRTHVRARRQQHRGEIRVAVHRCPVERCHPVALGCVDVAALLDERPHRLDVVPHRRIRDRRRRCGTDRRHAERQSTEEDQTLSKHCDHLSTSRDPPSLGASCRAAAGKPTRPTWWPSYSDPAFRVLSPNDSICVPSNCNADSIAFAIGVPSLAFRWRFPFSFPPAWPATNNGHRLWL